MFALCLDAGEQTFFVCRSWLGSSACSLQYSSAAPPLLKTATSLSPVELLPSSTDPRRALKEYKVSTVLPTLKEQLCIAQQCGWPNSCMLLQPIAGAGHNLHALTRCCHATFSSDCLLSHPVLQIVTYTSDIKSAGTDASVFVELIDGNGASSERRQLLTSAPDAFERGKADSFSITCQALSNMARLRVGHDGRGAKPSWHLSKVIMGCAAASGGDAGTFACVVDMTDLPSMLQEPLS